MKEIEAIREALAAGPTPGPWRQQDHAKFSIVGAIGVATCGGYSSNTCDPEKLHDEMLANATYIATCNPAAMRKIIAHIDAQDAEIERLRADAERYRWLRKQHWSKDDIAVVVNPKKQTRLGAICPSLGLLDDTIDHMRKETP